MRMREIISYFRVFLFTNSIDASGTDEVPRPSPPLRRGVASETNATSGLYFN